MKKNSYNLCKDGITSKISINLKYDDSYNVKPKVKGKGTIEVNKINFLSPDFSEKLIKKKIELKILNILKRVENSDEDDGTSAIEKSIIEAEKLRIKIINNYVKYLGNTYQKLTLKKLGIIIDNLKYQLIEIEQRKQDELLLNFNTEELTSKKSR